MNDTLSASGIIPIDTLMGSLDQVTSVYLIDAPEPTLIETGPAASADTLAAGLNAAGIDPDGLAHVVLTHIHLDHAGGAGTLSRVFPSATFWIHPSVAVHLADPTRLIASASRIYTEEGVRQLFGHPEPVAADRIRSLEEGTELILGDRRLRALHTPGHAASHVALQDLGTDMIFTGDAVGVHLPGPDVFRPAAPPPEFDLPSALTSIERIGQYARGSLLFAHFGAVQEVEASCATASDTLRRWATTAEQVVSDGGGAPQVQEALADVEGLDRSVLEPDDLARLELMGSYRLNALGMERYWRKRAQA